MERLNVLQTGQLTPEQAGVISGAINSYIAKVGPEMLPKTPDQIMKQAQTGQSVVLVDGKNNVMFHATGYENLNARHLDVLGFQVVEFGSWVAMVRGQRIGVTGAIELLNHSNEIFGDNAIFLATHKRINALNISLHDLKFDQVLYEDFPYLAYLTCTCENCSESFGFTTCPFRFKELNSRPDENGKIDCTLVISSVEKAREFERRCREASQKLGIEPLQPGERITTQRMQIAKTLFDRIGGE